MKTVFFVHSVGVVGGAERVTLTIIDGIKNEFHTVLLAPEEGSLSEQAKLVGSEFEEIDCNQPELTKPLRTAIQFWQYFKLFQKYKPDAVHCGDLLALRSLQSICKWMKVKLICHVHFPYELSFIEWVFRNRYSPYSFIFCSDELKRNIAPHLKQYCPTSKMEVIHNGIDVNKFSKAHVERSQIPNIGIVANLQYRKGHDDFLDMAKLIIDNGELARFHIIGGDILEAPREPLLRQKAQQLGIEEHVIFYGQVNNVHELITKLDVYVCASHEEAFPLSILEAMASKRAIVSTNVNGIPEALDDQVNGLLVSPHSPTELADAVTRLIRDPALSEKLSQNALTKVKKLFSRDVFITKVLNHYKQM